MPSHSIKRFPWNLERQSQDFELLKLAEMRNELRLRSWGERVGVQVEGRGYIQDKLCALGLAKVIMTVPWLCCDIGLHFLSTHYSLLTPECREHQSGAWENSNKVNIRNHANQNTHNFIILTYVSSKSMLDTIFMVYDMEILNV